MCNIKSALALKDRIFMPFDHDGHEEMIKELKLDDTSASPKFVRVEITPKDGSIFNHNLDNWQLRIDQDLIPEWFNKDKTEREMKEELKKWFAERFLVDDRTWQKRKNQRLFVKNSSVVARGNSSVVAWENSSVEARGNSSVVAWENSSVVAWENSSVVAWENSQILIPSSVSVKIKGVYDMASVKDIPNKKIIIADPKIKLVKFKEVKKDDNNPSK